MSPPINEDNKSNVLVISELERTDDDRVYMRVNDHFDVKLVKTDEGIVVDIFAWGSTGESFGSTYAFDQEAINEIEEFTDE
jgi:hypothetical protein